MTRTNRQSQLQEVRAIQREIPIEEPQELFAQLSAVYSAIDKRILTTRLKSRSEDLAELLMKWDDETKGDAPEEELPGSFSEPVELDARTQRSYP